MPSAMIVRFSSIVTSSSMIMEMVASWSSSFITNRLALKAKVPRSTMPCWKASR